MDEDEFDDIELLGAILDEEMDDDDELGRRVSRRGRSSRGGSRVLARYRQKKAIKKASYMAAINPAVPGVPSLGARNYPLGFGSFTFVNAGVTQAILNARPQKPFKGDRLVIDVRRSAGATAELVTVTSLSVGSNNQLVSTAALPAEAFSPNSFDTKLSLDPATPGIDIDIGIAISAQPGVGETVTVSAMLIGSTIG